MLITTILLQVALAIEPIHQTLSAPRDVWDVTAQDLNDDGKLDLVALYGERDASVDKKGLCVYIAKSTGGYAKQATFDFPLDENTGNVFFAKRDGRSQLVVTTKDGATQYKYNGDTFVESREYSFSTLLPMHTREPVFLRYISHDLDGDDSDEWILPVVDGFDVWGNDQNLAHLDADIFSETFGYKGMNVTHRIPAVLVFERPGESRKALGVVGERGVVFYYGDNWETSKRYDLPEQSKEQWDRFATLADINNDGNPDLMVSSTKGTANIEVRIEIFLADGNLKYPAKPTFEYTTKGGLATPILMDVNNDEKLDIIVRGFPISLRNIANYLFRKKITMKIDMHLFKNTTFSKKPSYTSNISSEVSEGREENAHTYGDFDGDGKKDIATSTRSDTLSIFTHSKGRAINSRAWKTIKVHTFGVARISDLDANGKDDIVIYHPRGDHQKEIDIIRF
jgi:hypothetical protein